jgi:hypothetical protein
VTEKTTLLMGEIGKRQHNRLFTALLYFIASIFTNVKFAFLLPHKQQKTDYSKQNTDKYEMCVRLHTEQTHHHPNNVQAK